MPTMDQHTEAILDAPNLPVLLDALDAAGLHALASLPLDRRGGVAWALRQPVRALGHPFAPRAGLRALPDALAGEPFVQLLDWLTPQVRAALLPSPHPDPAWVHAQRPQWLEQPLRDVILATRPALLDRYWRGLDHRTLGDVLSLPLGGVSEPLPPTGPLHRLPHDLHRCVAEHLVGLRRRELDIEAARAGLRRGPAHGALRPLFDRLSLRWEAQPRGLLDRADLVPRLDDTAVHLTHAGARIATTWLRPLDLAVEVHEPRREADAVGLLLDLLRRRHHRSAVLFQALHEEPGPRVLRLLDAHLAQAAPLTTAVGFRLRVGRDGLHLTAVRCELDPSGRWTVVRGDPPAAAPQDPRAARALRALDLDRRQPQGSVEHRMATAWALVGHPRVFDAHDRPMPLFGHRARLVLARAGPQIATHWAAGDVVWSSDEAHEALSLGDGRLAWHRPGPLHLIDFVSSGPLVQALRRVGDRVPPSAVDGLLARVPDLARHTDVVVDPALATETRDADSTVHVLLDRHPVARLPVMEALEGMGSTVRLPADARRRLTRLRQLACHPRLVHPDAPATSSKLRAARRVLEARREAGERVLVFSRFTRLLDLLAQALVPTGLRAGRVDGRHRADPRQATVDAFQRGELDVLLLSLQAAGTGLTLTEARCVLHLEPWWNPAARDQATDRAHRIGQTHAVTAIHLIAEDTVEEGIRQLQHEKARMTEPLIHGHDGGPRLTGERLLQLVADGGLDTHALDLERRVGALLAPEVRWPLPGLDPALATGFEAWVLERHRVHGHGSVAAARAVAALLRHLLARDPPVHRDTLEPATRALLLDAEAGTVPLPPSVARRVLPAVRDWLASEPAP